MVQTFEELVCLAVWEGQGHGDLWPDLIYEVSLWYEWLNCSQDSASITDFCLLENSKVIKMTFFSTEIILLRLGIFGSCIEWKIQTVVPKILFGSLIWTIKFVGFRGSHLIHNVKNSYENSFEWCSDVTYLIWQTWGGNHCPPSASGTWVTRYRGDDLYAWPQSCLPLCLPRPESGSTKEWCTLPQPQMKSEWPSNNTSDWIISYTPIPIEEFIFS